MLTVVLVRALVLGEVMRVEATTNALGPLHDLILDPKGVKHHGDVETRHASTDDTDRQGRELGSRGVRRWRRRVRLAGTDVAIEEVLDRLLALLGEGGGTGVGLLGLWSGDFESVHHVDGQNKIVVLGPASDLLGFWCILDENLIGGCEKMNMKSELNDVRGWSCSRAFPRAHRVAYSTGKTESVCRGHGCMRLTMKVRNLLLLN